MYDQVRDAALRVIAVAWRFMVGKCSAIAGQGDPERSLCSRGGWMKGLIMIAVCTPPDDYPQLIAQEAEASFILDKPRAGYATLVLIARRAAGQEVRFPLVYQTITRLIDFINGCYAIHCFAGRIAENDRDLVFLYEHGRFEIRRREQSIVMSPPSAYQLVEALRASIA